jgi:lysophospholipase L1-like esterase
MSGPANSKYVLFLGDSHTLGQHGSDFVGLLTPTAQGLGAATVRAGVGGECSDTIADRLPGLLQQHGPPAAAAILAGTNNVIAGYSAGWLKFYRHGKKTAHSSMSLDVYKADLTRMVQMLQAQAPGCAILLVTLPPLGETSSHPLAATIQEHNTALKDVAAQYKGEVTVVDFHAACQQHLQQHTTPSKPPAPACYLDLPTWSLVWKVLEMLFLHSVVRLSWNSIATMRGRVLLHDDVHLNETAGHLLARQLQPLLQKALSTS